MKGTPPGRGLAPQVKHIGFRSRAHENRSFRVATPHGRTADVGTRFAVRTDARSTVVTVAEGLVACTTRAGRLRVKQGHQCVLAETGSIGCVHRMLVAWDESAADYQQRTASAAWSGTHGPAAGRDYVAQPVARAALHTGTRALFDVTHWSGHGSRIRPPITASSSPRTQASHGAPLRCGPKRPIRTSGRD
ncbi:MAG: FecR domain-containing protein [Kiritimatiellae bacterium]|nr:FecR domain-containing protein [Kiritimatiellia bacterium]